MGRNNKNTSKKQCIITNIHVETKHTCTTAAEKPAAHEQMDPRRDIYGVSAVRGRYEALPMETRLHSDMQGTETFSYLQGVKPPKKQKFSGDDKENKSVLRTRKTEPGNSKVRG